MNCVMEGYSQELQTDILTVGRFLADNSLTIPIYQRPYKWDTHHVSQLIADLSQHRGKAAYRLGTVVFHRDSEKKNIVDGQQRTITLMLIVHALLKHRLGSISSPELREQLEELGKAMSELTFTSDISRHNIQCNYQEISRQVARSDFTEEHIAFLLNRCELVSVTLCDISEAFQFFDSQNARGRDLEPHDLLKAYHLREFSPEDNNDKAVTVATWENSNSEELATLFARYLYRIRCWAKGDSARHFGKKDVGLFKGVNIDSSSPYPYVSALRTIHHTVDDYNRHFTRRIDGRRIDYPFQLDQTIINGRRFFEMIRYYQQHGFHLPENSRHPSPLSSHNLDGFAPDILVTIDNYGGRHRTGDHYVRSMFDCLLMYFYDKFGAAEISRAIEKSFIWSFSLRLKMQNVQLASMDNHVLENNPFRVLREATHPREFLNLHLPMVKSVASSRTEAIAQLFTQMGYLDE